MKKIISLVLPIVFGLTLLVNQISVHAAPESGIVNAGNKFCPVSGDKVSEKAGVVEYKGKNYNLCCPMCAKKFLKDPEKYLAKLKTQEGALIGEQNKKSSNSMNKKMHEKDMVKMYQCPMDGYTSDKPGMCAKCGMKLEEKEMTSDQAKAAMEKKEKE